MWNDLSTLTVNRLNWQFFLFLNASSHLYERLCLYVGPSMAFFFLFFAENRANWARSSKISALFLSTLMKIDKYDYMYNGVYFIFYIIQIIHQIIICIIALISL